MQEPSPTRFRALQDHVAVGVVVAVLLTGARAEADSLSDPASSPNSVVVPTPLSNGAASPNAPLPNSTTGQTPPAIAATSRYENLMLKGLNIDLPPPIATIDPEGFGLRSQLADLGIGYQFFSLNTAYDNLLHAAKETNGQQLYVGQQPTAQSTDALILTYDTSRLGISGGQLAVFVAYTSVTWAPFGPNGLNVASLTWYQSLLRKRIELKIGLINNGFEFGGPLIAGSASAGVFGPSGSLFVQAGLTEPNFPTYGANVTTHITDELYDKAGVARGISPLGPLVEHNQNSTAFNWSVPGAGVDVVDEIGYLHSPSSGTPKTWVRGGGVFSSSHYVNLDRPGHTSSNYMLYLLADRQFLQTSYKPFEAYRGLYGGFSIEYAPPNLNTFSQYYEARIYGLGLLPGRPFDQTSLVFSDTIFSHVLRAEAMDAGFPTHHDTKTLTYSYSAQVVRGIYASVGLGYTNNPTVITYTSKAGSDLNLIAGISLFL